MARWAVLSSNDDSVSSNFEIASFMIVSWMVLQLLGCGDEEGSDLKIASELKEWRRVHMSTSMSG